MDEIFAWLAILLLLGAGGWILGIVGFFSARRALREVGELRRQDGAAQAAFAAPPSAAWADVPEPPPESAAQAEAEPEIIAPEPELVAAEPAALPPEPPGRPDIEALLTTRWGVWLGSAALLMAGVFLIRYAVDEGLLGPAIRCILAALLGIALLAGAEWLRRREAIQQVIVD